MARILLAEDDIDVRLVVAEALTHEGHDVTAPVDFDRAAEYLNSSEWDLLISNMMLVGGGGGRDLARLAKARGVPTLFVTGDFAQMAVLESEGVLFLRKPFRLQDLHAAVAAASRAAPGATRARPA